jgi:hypothetical protein
MDWENKKQKVDKAIMLEQEVPRREEALREFRSRILRIKEKESRSFEKKVKALGYREQSQATSLEKTTNDEVHPSLDLKTQEGHWEFEAPRWEQAQNAQDIVPFWRSQLGGKGVNPTQLSARRGPPTDRPPDKPPPWKGAIGGSDREGRPPVR